MYLFLTLPCSHNSSVLTISPRFIQSSKNIKNYFGDDQFTAAKYGWLETQFLSGAARRRAREHFFGHPAASFFAEATRPFTLYNGDGVYWTVASADFALFSYGLYCLLDGAFKPAYPSSIIRPPPSHCAFVLA